MNQPLKPKALIDLRTVELTSDCRLGIYFLVHKDLIVYIGKSSNVLARLGAHTNKQYDRVYFLSTPAEWVHYWERHYIQQFKTLNFEDAFQSNKPPFDGAHERHHGYTQGVRRL